MSQKLVEGMWDIFARRVIPSSAGAVQRQEMKRAFFAGVTACMETVLLIGEDDVSEKDGMATLDALYQECLSFLNDVREGTA